MSRTITGMDNRRQWGPQPREKWSSVCPPPDIGLSLLCTHHVPTKAEPKMASVRIESTSMDIWVLLKLWEPFDEDGDIIDRNRPTAGNKKDRERYQRYDHHSLLSSVRFSTKYPAYNGYRGYLHSYFHLETRKIEK